MNQTQATTINKKHIADYSFHTTYIQSKRFRLGIRLSIEIFHLDSLNLNTVSIRFRFRSVVIASVRTVAFIALDTLSTAATQHIFAVRYDLYALVDLVY